MNHSQNNKMIPKESNVYRKSKCEFHSTPYGSYNSSFHAFYKHIIPSGLETEIQNNLKGLSFNNGGFENLSHQNRPLPEALEGNTPETEIQNNLKGLRYE